jgi:hypothetical protein
MTIAVTLQEGPSGWLSHGMGRVAWTRRFRNYNGAARQAQWVMIGGVCGSHDFLGNCGEQIRRLPGESGLRDILMI